MSCSIRVEFCICTARGEKRRKTLVVSISLQMGWTLSPDYLFTSAETERYVAEHCINALVGTMQPHPPEKQTIPENGINCMPDKKSEKGRKRQIPDNTRGINGQFHQHLPAKIGGTSNTSITSTHTWDTHSLTNITSNQIWQPRPSIRSKTEKNRACEKQERKC